MADVLKATLYWHNSQTHDVGDVNGCVPTFTDMTNAQSYDASDTTYSQLATSDDAGNVLNADSWAWNEAHVDTASVSGTITFIRVKIRARQAVTAGTGPISKEWSPYINGTRRGNLTGLSTSYTWMTEDFATDPADGVAWTNAKINAQKFGYEIRLISSDGAYSTAANIRVSEVALEVWGPGADTVNVPTADVTASLGTAVLLAGALTLGCDSGGVATIPTDPTVTGGAVSHALPAAETLSWTDDDAWFTEAAWNPSQTVSKATFIDNGSNATVVRSNTAPFYDKSDATRDLLSSPGTWPNSGTLTFNFGGTQGSASIDGVGAISGVKVYARVRARKDTNATLNNFRFTVGANTVALEAQPTVSGMPPAAAAYETVESVLMTTNPLGVAWEWGTGVNGIFVQMATGWTFRADYSIGGAYAGEFAQVEVSEAWLEVYGLNGSEPELVELKARTANVIVTQAVDPLVEE